MAGAKSRSGPFPYELEVATRWLDNDQYGHVNNSAFYLVSDTVINTYLVSHCGLQPFQHAGSQPSTASSSATPDIGSVIGLIISSSATYFAPASFPSVLVGALRVLKLGRSSVTYEVGIFELPRSDGKNRAVVPPDAKAVVVTRATHVFVDRTSRRPVKEMPKSLREGLQKLVVEGHSLDEPSPRL